MPGDTRIQGLANHADAMVALLEDISSEMLDKAAVLKTKPGYNPEALAFLEDLAVRADDLAELIEEDILSRIMGINNLLGPTLHLLAAEESGSE